MYDIVKMLQKGVYFDLKKERLYCGTFSSIVDFCQGTARMQIISTLRFVDYSCRGSATE